MSDSPTLVVTGGSAIDGNTANVNSPASLSPLSSLLIRQEAIDVRSLRKIDFAMLELGGDAALARAPAHREEEAPSLIRLPRWRWQTARASTATPLE